MDGLQQQLGVAVTLPAEVVCDLPGTSSKAPPPAKLNGEARPADDAPKAPRQLSVNMRPLSAAAALAAAARRDGLEARAAAQAQGLRFGRGVHLRRIRPRIAHREQNRARACLRKQIKRRG